MARNGATKKGIAKKGIANMAAAAPAGGGGGGGGPFGSIEELLLHVLTLRGNAAYREDVKLLANYEAQPAPHNDWVSNWSTDKPAFGAARSLIGTWDLVCTIVQNHYSSDTDLFIKHSPVAYLYLQLKPAIEKLRKDIPDDTRKKEYAAAFEAMGEKAVKDLGQQAPRLRSIGTWGSLTSADEQQYRSVAVELSRPMTHFG